MSDGGLIPAATLDAAFAALAAAKAGAEAERLYAGIVANLARAFGAARARITLTLDIERDADGQVAMRLRAVAESRKPPPDADKTMPWVLIQKGKPALRFATQKDARSFYDSMRRNRAPKLLDATLFGPGGEIWRCRRFADASWERGERGAWSRDKALESAEVGEANP